MGEPTEPAKAATVLGVQVAYFTQDDLNEAGVLWPVTHQLCELILAEEGSLRGKSLVELGSGTGALSAAAAKLGAIATATDLPAVVPLCERTVAANAPYPPPGEARAAAHAWGEPVGGLGAPFHLVVACECAYWGGWDILAEDTRKSFCDSILALSGAGTRVYIGFTIREAGREVEKLRMLGRALGLNLSFRAPGARGRPLPEGLEEGEVVLAVGTVVASSISLPSPLPRPVTARLITYNVNRLDGDEGGVLRVLSLCAPDLIALQLAPRDFVERCRGALGGQWHVAYSEAHGGFGNALLSRFPFAGAVGAHPLPAPGGGEPRSALACRVACGGAAGSLDVWVTHLDNTSEGDRVAQAEAVADLARAGGVPHLLCALRIAGRGSGSTSLGGLLACYGRRSWPKNATRVADYPKDTWEAFAAFADARGWEPRQERVVSALEGRGYRDLFLVAGGGGADPCGDPSSATFYLPPAGMHLRIDYVLASAAAAERVRARRCWVGGGCEGHSNHRPLLLDFDVL